MEDQSGAVKILGGFFVYRSKPSESKPISEVLNIEGSSTGKDFLQKGEVVGMVIIKKNGARTYMGYSEIDPEKFKIEPFMTYFADTDPYNPYDNNLKQVFDIDTLPELMNKMIIQPLGQVGEPSGQVGEPSGQVGKSSGQVGQPTEEKETEGS